MSEQLIQASKDGNLKMVQEILAKGAKIDYKDADGLTALLWAVNKGHLPLVKYLVKEAKPKASLTEANSSGDTPLLMAAWKGQTETLKYLLTKVKSDAILIEKNNDGSTALHLAAREGHTETVKYLLTKTKSKTSLTAKNKIGNTALLMAAWNGHTETVKYLLTEANPKASLTEKNNRGETAMLLAACSGCTETLKYLLTEAVPKASLSEKNNSGYTALLSAACNGKTEILKYLLTEANPRANLNERNEGGVSALTLSAWKGQVESVAYLLFQGVYIDMLSNNGNTTKQECVKMQALIAIPLLNAAEDLIKAATEKETKINIEATLATLGMGVNARSMKQNFNTALHLAILNENIKVVLSLLNAGASFEILNGDGLTPYDLTMMSIIPFIKMLGHIVKANQLAKEITLQIQGDKNIVEKLTSELETSISKAVEIYENLKDIDKQKVFFQLGSILVLPENAPHNAVKAYELLIKVDKSNQNFAKANGLIYRMLSGNHLILTKSIKSDGLGLDAEQAVIPIDPKDQEPLEQSKVTQEFTLQTMIKHHIYSGLKDEHLKHHLAAYALGNYHGIVSNALKEFQHFQETESCLVFIDAMRKENLALKRSNKAQKKEIEAQKGKNDKQKMEKESQRAEIVEHNRELEAQNAENDKQNKEIESLKHEMEVLKAQLAALGVDAGAGATSSVPLLSQFQSSIDNNNASAQTAQINSGSALSAKFQKI